jgi:hypothetical protein
MSGHHIVPDGRNERRDFPFDLGSFNPGALPDEEINGLYWMLHQERRLRGITSSNLWPIFSRDPVALMLDRAIRVLRVRGAALELVRAEVDLPEHVAEAVGSALE